MDKKSNRLKLRILASLAQLGYWKEEEKLFSLEFPGESELRKLKITSVVNYLDEQFRDPGEFLKAGLKDKSNEVKKCTLKLIKKLNDDRFIEEIIPLLEDKNEEIAEMAVEVICGLKSEEKELLKPLVNLILNEKKGVSVRANAIKSLRYDNDSTIILDTLVSLLENKSVKIRMEAARSIKYLTDHELVLNTILEKLYSDPKEEIELSLVWAIASIKSQKTVEYIKNYLNHENPDFQEAAIFGLGNSGDDSQVEELLNKLKDFEKNN